MTPIQILDFTPVINHIISECKVYVFNTKHLPEYKTPMESIRIHPEFKNIFDDLSLKKNSCIYWFELDSNENCELLNQSLTQYRNRLERVVPVTGKHKISKFLYLGIRRGGHYKRDEGYTHIVDRIKVHLGYVKSGKTQGLQLSHWAKNIDMNITLKVYEFPKDFRDLHLEAIEKIMAEELKPICGKH